jgi:uncharacterized protein
MNAPRLFSLTFLVALTCAVACSRRTGDPGASSGTPGTSSGADLDAGTFDKAALLSAFGACAHATYDEFQIAAGELETAAKAAESEGSSDTHAGVREAWSRAIDVWQRAELFQFGPAAMPSSPGGQDMRDGIYAWPLVGRCLIESMIVDQIYDKPEFATALVSTKSLATMEYLLFYEGTDNACAETNTINAQGTWNAIGEAELARRKAAYARAIAVDVAARARALASAWAPGEGDFVGQLSGAGQRAPYASQQMAFNAVSDAMFYLDIQLKNMKVGQPAGLVECPAGTCSVESPWAKRSKEHLRQNVAGYDALLRGCEGGGEGLGFDDLLSAVGAPQVAAKLGATVVEINAALDGLTEATLEEDIAKNPAGVQRLFDALRANAVVMKSEMATVLDLELPQKVEGDND